MPSTIGSETTVDLGVDSAAGVRSVQVRLGNRVICTLTAPPYSCKVSPTGADVGSQTLVATVVDNNGNTTVTSKSVTVPRFKSQVSIKIRTKKLKGGKVRRTITGTVLRGRSVSAAEGCKGRVTVIIKRDGRSLLNQQVSLSKKCTFTRSVTSTSNKQRFSVSAKFPGNNVLTSASKSRRFS